MVDGLHHDHEHGKLTATGLNRRPGGNAMAAGGAMTGEGRATGVGLVWLWY